MNLMIGMAFSGQGKKRPCMDNPPRENTEKAKALGGVNTMAAAAF